MSTVGDARKRQQAASASKSPLSQPNSPEAGPSQSGWEIDPQANCECGATGWHICPIPAPVDSGAIGRLNEAESGWEAICPCGHRVTWHHDTRGCEYFGTRPERRCQCLLTSDAATSRILREHTDRALAEVEQRIEARSELLHEAFAEAKRGMGIATHIVRAARQEQGR